MVSFNLQKLFNSLTSHLLIVSLSDWAILILFRKLFLVHICLRLSPLSILSCSVILCWGLCLTWICVFCKDLHRDMHSSTDIQFDHNQLKRLFLLFSVHFQILYKNSGIHSCVHVCLGLKVEFIDQCFCF